MKQQMVLLDPGLPACRVQGDIDTLSTETRQARSALPVALVTMPFVSTRYPSIQLGTLSAIAKSHGFPVDSFHLNLDLAHQMGQKLYQALSVHRGRLWGDWLFSLAAFGEDAPDPDSKLLYQVGYDELIFLVSLLKDPRKAMPSLRQETIPRYLDSLMERIDWGIYKVVGFSSTFQQNTASFALARRIKEKYPEVITLFGGSNFDDEMGLEFVRTMDAIDYAIIGEGDIAFPSFLIAMQEGRDPLTIPGVVGKRNGRVHRASGMRSLLRQMDELPAPDYHDFYERRAHLTLPNGEEWEETTLPFESSRGCWWGEKHHCTFCGLNALGMNFRSKSVDRVLHELAEMSQTYGKFDFSAVDNIIEPRYLKGLFSKLNEEGGRDYTFFYEVKANMSREQIKTLSIGGVKAIQPGLESLSSHVLELMHKGVKAIQNVNLLRWAVYYEVRVHWNILWGFPGETQADYDQQTELMPRLTHLYPPDTSGRIWMERFSPIFFDRDSFPATEVRPELSYRYVYPGHVALDKIAYFFDYQLNDTLPNTAYRGLKKAILEWQQLWGRNPGRRPFLTFWHSPKLLRIQDGRDPDHIRECSFAAPEADVYLACSDKPQTAQSLSRHLSHLALSTNEIQEILQRFANNGLMMQDENLYLSLALPASKWR